MGEFVSTLGNPWLATEFNVTRQGEFFRKYGAARAGQYAELARVANERDRPRVEARTFILTRKIGGGGGLVGAGSSGDGPPE